MSGIRSRATGRPSTRCEAQISARSPGVTPAYQTLSGCTATCRTAAAVLEAVGAVHHDAAVEAALLQQDLQLVEEGLAILLAAGPLRVPRRAGVDADEDLALGLRHGLGSSIPSRVSRATAAPRERMSR